jgi:hypothetical protein
MRSLPGRQSSRPSFSLRAHPDIPTTALSGHDQMSLVQSAELGSIRGRLTGLAIARRTRDDGDKREGEVGQDEAREEGGTGGSANCDRRNVGSARRLRCDNGKSIATKSG